MRIERYSGLEMSYKSFGKRIRGVSVPDYDSDNFYTKTSPKMSDEKFREIIVKQAQKDATTGKFGVECPGFKSLMKSFVSVASPDRKGIITNALTSLGKMNKLPKAEAISLLDILLGKRIISADHELSYADFKDSSGEIVATFSNGTWHAMGTPAEDARASEFYGIYRDAWNAAKSETANTPVPTAANSIDITT